MPKQHADRQGLRPDHARPGRPEAEGVGLGDDAPADDPQRGRDRSRRRQRQATRATRAARAAATRSSAAAAPAVGRRFGRRERRRPLRQHRDGQHQHRGQPRAPLRAARPKANGGNGGGAKGLGAEVDDLLGRGMPRLRDLQVLLLRRPPVRLEDDGHRAAPQGLAGRRRHDPRPIGQTDPDVAPHLLFEIRPAGRGAPRSTRSRSSTAGSCSRRPRSTAPPARTPSTTRARSVGQILLMTKTRSQRHVLADPRIEIYSCGRHDIRHRPDRPPRARRRSSSWPRAASSRRSPRSSAATAS